MVIVTNDPFKSWFDFEVRSPIYEFEVKVCIPTRVPPRDKMFEYLINVGLGDMERLFNERKPLKAVNVLWVFPERWLTVHEQQALMYVIDKCGLRGELKSLRMITHSPLIIGDFTRDHIRIITTGSDVSDWWSKKK